MNQLVGYLSVVCRRKKDYIMCVQLYIMCINSVRKSKKKKVPKKILIKIKWMHVSLIMQN